MANNEARINLGKGYGGGLQVTLKVDSSDELAELVNSLFGDVTGTALLNAVLHAFALEAGAEVAALDAVNRGLGPITTVPAVTQPAVTQPQVSTVGQPLPQPGYQAPAAQPAANPPGLEYPGNCLHGVRTYISKPGKGGQLWNRWECAIPWKPGRDEATKQANAQRCEAINV